MWSDPCWQTQVRCMLKPAGRHREPGQHLGDMSRVQTRRCVQIGPEGVLCLMSPLFP